MRYNNMGQLLSIPLENNFTVFANYSRKGDQYVVNFAMKHDLIDNYQRLEGLDDTKIEGNVDDVRLEILKFITKKFNCGELDYYMDRIEFEQECFELGYPLIGEKDV